MRKLLNSELNRLSTEEFKQAAKIPLIVILDNVRSQHNVGSVFRTSDAFRVEAICLCGITATPPNPEIHKSALGAENTVDWKYYEHPLQAVRELKDYGYTIISIEQTDQAIPIEDFVIKPESKYAIIFGNEVKGVCQEVIEESNYCIEIRQFGTKHSLNISVSAGIVIWEFFKHLKTSIQ
ncbi:MAG: RNA methyltransferase [Bacteroidales bacterium]|nr:RNA methyltransferase [Bacteroidales bacterium]